MEFDKIELGRRLAKRRKKLKMKQHQLAELVGVNSNHISSIEHGKIAPNLECFVKICDALKITLDYLLEGAMHSNNVPQNIVEHLRLCSDPDIDLVACIVKFLADRNASR